MSISNDCSIWVELDGHSVKIPVNPSEIEIEHTTDSQVFDVLGLGEINVQGKPKLSVISWESFFPSSTDAPYTDKEALSPKEYRDIFIKAQEEQQKGRVIITRSGLYDTNMRCTVESFVLTDKGGETKDIYYSIQLREYRDYEPETIQVIKKSGKKKKAKKKKKRTVETPVLRVGATVIANGKYYYDSYGSKPFGTAHNLKTTVTRITKNPYPIHIGHYGWLKKEQLQIKG